MRSEPAIFLCSSDLTTPCQSDDGIPVAAPSTAQIGSATPRSHSRRRGSLGGGAGVAAVAASALDDTTALREVRRICIFTANLVLA